MTCRAEPYSIGRSKIKALHANGSAITSNRISHSIPKIGFKAVRFTVKITSPELEWQNSHNHEDDDLILSRPSEGEYRFTIGVQKRLGERVK